MNLALFKKQLAKDVKSVQEIHNTSVHSCEYPKLIMTDNQMKKGTGTINCGWVSSFRPKNDPEVIKTKSLAESVLDNKEIRATLAYYGALENAKIEFSKANNAWQIRFYYNI